MTIGFLLRCARTVRIVRSFVPVLGVLLGVSAWSQAPADGVPATLIPAQRVAHAAHAEMLGIAVVGQRLVTVGDHGVVLLSDDAGGTWRQAASVPVDVKLNATSFVDDKQGWAVGHRGVILHTQDGGNTWALQRVATQEDRPLFAVHFFDAHRGVAVGLWSLVLLTDDGGATWREQTLAPPPGAKRADLNLLGLFADGKGRLFAVAEKGMVLVSDDQGHAWRYIDTGYKGSFWTGTATSDGALVVAGLRGSLYRSIDDGKSWERIETGGKASITGVVAAEGRVLVVGLDGPVLRSKDNAASFEAAMRPDRLSLTAAALLPGGREVLLSRDGPVESTPKQ
jgi:photosystem II stability/assembly factor-like uncharacterized protein